MTVMTIIYISMFILWVLLSWRFFKVFCRTERPPFAFVLAALSSLCLTYVLLTSLTILTGSS